MLTKTINLPRSVIISVSQIYFREIEPKINLSKESLGNDMIWKHIISICDIKFVEIIRKNLHSNSNLIDFSKLLNPELINEDISNQDGTVTRFRSPITDILALGLWTYELTRCYTLIDFDSQDSLVNLIVNKFPEIINQKELKKFIKENIVLEDLKILRGNLIGHESTNRLIQAYLKRGREPMMITIEHYLEEITKIFDKIFNNFEVDFDLRNFLNQMEKTYSVLNN